MRIEPCIAGRGHMRVENIRGQSVATSWRAQSPLKILTPRFRGRSVWATISSLGGGLVAGDQISLSLSLGDETRCFLGTQASTKVFRNPQSRPCGHHLRAELGCGAILACVPDPVQAFQGASYRQHQEFFLASRSGLVLVDWLCSGRVARGERWAFSAYRSCNEITVEGEQVLMDTLFLDPTDGPLDGPYRMGRFNCFATVVLIGVLFQKVSSRIFEEINQLPVGSRKGLSLSASPVRGGVLVRLAGESLEHVGQEIRRFLAFLSEYLGDDPWSRKW